MRTVMNSYPRVIPGNKNISRVESRQKTRGSQRHAPNGPMRCKDSVEMAGLIWNRRQGKALLPLLCYLVTSLHQFT